MPKLLAALALVILAGCRPTTPVPDAGLTDITIVEAGAAPASTAATPGKGSATVVLVNETSKPVEVSVAFGANSVAKLPTLCGADAGLTCSLPLAAKSEVPLPLAGQWLNATFSFGAPVACGSTKAEINVNNPAWYDITDISLVDGFSNALRIDTTDTADGGLRILGPVWSATGNERNYGVFPNGCDICVARQKPSCGMPPGKDGCKGGTQYNPDVPCQHQGAAMGGGGAYRVVYLGDLRPAK